MSDIDFLQPVEDEILYHYTNLAGFKGILESKSLHLTHVSYLNDLTEFEDGVKFICNRLRSPGKDKKYNDLIDLREKALLFGVTGRTKVNLCAFSFCPKGKDNLLNQWRVYGQDGFGLAIGFDTKIIKEICEKNSFYFGKCFYLDKEKDNTFDDMVKELSEMMGAGQDEEIFIKNVGIFSLFSKNGYFKEENEIRMATHPDITVDVKESSNRLVVFHRLDVEKEMPNLIKEVIIGPCHRDTLNETYNTIEVLLRKLEIADCIIKDSKDIPYRGYKK